MRIETTLGREITSIDDWSTIYLNTKKHKHWKEHRSAYSVAEFILNQNGAEAIQNRVSDVLGVTVQLDRAIVEYEVRFDNFGKGREHDLGIFGRTESGKTVFIGVEAKVDEAFGYPLLDTYLLAKSNQIAGISTNAPERIERILALHYSTPNPSMFDGPYQLLYATAGTLAEDADIHLLYVIVFKTPLYDESKGVDNYRDYIHFMYRVGAKPLRLPDKEAVGHKLFLGGKELVCWYENFDLNQP